MKTSTEKHAWVNDWSSILLLVGRFSKDTEYQGRRAHSHPEPCPLFQMAKRGLRAYTEALRMLKREHPPFCVLCRDKTEENQCIPQKLCQLLSLSSLQTESVEMLALYRQSRW